MELLRLFGTYWSQILLIALFSYFLGSLNFSIIVVNFFHRSGLENGERIDIRREGSHNAGFTNVLRSVGVKSAILTFLGDFGKGFFATFITKLVLSKNPDFLSNPNNLKSMMFLSLFFCTVGHVYPCFFKFSGGKGILTTWAAILPINVWLFLALITIFLVILYITKIVSLASIVVTVAFPIFNAFFEFFINKSIFFDFFYSMFIIFLPFMVSLLVFYKHKGNFMRLLAGTEGQIHRKRK